METYRIVVPSRKRSHLAGRLLKMLPAAIIVVAESERVAYLKAGVVASSVVTHPELPNLPEIRNWIIDYFQESCIIQIDDDLKGVYSIISKRTITIADEIKRLIENSLSVASDLGLGVFCWSRTHNISIMKPDRNPFNFCSPISSSFGLRGASRTRRFDSEFLGKADFEFTLRTLIEDRIVLCDNRYYFNHGRHFTGSGGNVVSKSQIEKTDRLIKERYAGAVNFDGPGYRKGRGDALNGIPSFGLRIRRKVSHS